MTIQLSHVCISTSSLHETRRFFEVLFDATVVYESKRNGFHYGTFMKISKNTFVELFYTENIIAVDFPIIRHACFSVNDLDPFRTKLKLLGVYWEEKIGAIDKTKQIMIYGPQGLKIELHNIDSQSLLHPHI